MGDTVTRVCEFLVLCRRPGYRRRSARDPLAAFGQSDEICYDVVGEYEYVT